MKIFHVISGISKESGGPARSSQGLVASLRQVGVDAVLVSCHAGDTPWVEGVDRFYAPDESGLNAIKKFFERLFQDERPDVVHLHGIWQWQIHLAAVTARKLKIPYIETPRGMLELWSLEQKKWKKHLAMWLYQRRDLEGAAALHATAESEAEQFRKLGFLNPIIVSPNGVNLPSRGIRDEGLGIGEVSQLSTFNSQLSSAKGRRALFMSRMHPKKGVLELVEAWAQVRPQGWQCELVYTVNGAVEAAYEAQVKARIAELGLDEQFILTGPLLGDTKWDAYRRADFFVLPTYSENFGIVIAEALYAGLPVITTKGAPWAELEGIGDEGLGNSGRCGRWIDVGVKSLAAALREMMVLTDEQRAAMGARGRKLVEEKYTWPAIAEQMRKAYEGLMENAGGVDRGLQKIFALPHDELIAIRQHDSGGGPLSPRASIASRANTTRRSHENHSCDHGAARSGGDDDFL